jgi:hypothetical protein
MSDRPRGAGRPGCDAIQEAVRTLKREGDGLPHGAVPPEEEWVHDVQLARAVVADSPSRAGPGHCHAFELAMLRPFGGNHVPPAVDPVHDQGVVEVSGADRPDAVCRGCHGVKDAVSSVLITGMLMLRERWCPRWPPLPLPGI